MERRPSIARQIIGKALKNARERMNQSKIVNGPEIHSKQICRCGAVGRKKQFENCLLPKEAEKEQLEMQCMGETIN